MAAAVSANEANTLAAASAPSGANASNAVSSTEQRACDTPDCRVGKLISVVSKGKTSQFVSAPSIQEKPILLNGLTSVFQVTGNAAKLSDIKSATNDSDNLKPIYRIKPDSHVHIINYIVVDDDSDVVRKIADNDAQTMRILHESQRVSAEAKLRKLMANHVTVDVNTLVTKKSPHTGGGTNTTPLSSSLERAMTPATATTAQTQPVPAQVQPKATLTTQPTQVQLTAPSSAQAQARLGLSIASVAQGVPFISTVPLNALQAPAASAVAVEPASEVLSASSIVKMKEELDQLRRTVAQLAAQSTQSK